jgi:hypothetical protein
MPTQDQIMQQIQTLFGTGAAMSVTDEATDALQDRYYDWIVTVKSGNSTSPLDIWETTAGLAIQAQFVAIGTLAAVKTVALLKTAIEAEECLDACRETETAASATCPHCPPPPD